MSRESRARDERSTANATLASAENLPTNLRGQRDRARQEASDVDLLLAVPPGTIPDGYTGHWFNEDRVQQKLSEWWCHVTDSAGNNITRTYRDKKTYLMAMETSEVQKLDQLREKKYRASIGETESSAFDAKTPGLLEDYEPSGNKTKITKDVFTGL